MGGRETAHFFNLKDHMDQLNVKTESRESIESDGEGNEPRTLDLSLNQLQGMNSEIPDLATTQEF